MRRKIIEVSFNPYHPVRFLLYSDTKSIERMGFEPGRHVHVWRTWRNGIHFVGICYGLRVVREGLVNSVLHELGHVICHEIGHESHRVSSATVKEIQKALEEKAAKYRQPLNGIFNKFPPLGKLDALCQVIDLVDILKEFYANDVINKYSNYDRLEELTAEAENLLKGSRSFANAIPIVSLSPLVTLGPAMVSVVSEASVYRLSKRTPRLGNKLRQSHNRLDKIYENLPGQTAQLRKKLVPFFSTLNENPSSSEVLEYLSSLQEHVTVFFDAHTLWLQDAETLLRDARTLKDLLEPRGGRTRLV